MAGYTAPLDRMKEEFDRIQMERTQTVGEWEIRRWQQLSDRLREEINEYFEFQLWLRRTHPEVLDEWNALQKIKES